MSPPRRKNHKQGANLYKVETEDIKEITVASLTIQSPHFNKKLVLKLIIDSKNIK